MNLYTRQVDRLAMEQQRRSATVEGIDWYRLRVAPSCPPDKRIHLRGGLWYAGTYSWRADWDHRAFTVPNMIADLADPGSVTVDITFTNAGWYKFVTLNLALPAEYDEPEDDDWSFFIHETGDEFETAAEAEAWFNSDEFRDSEPWASPFNGPAGLPLCGLVLKNNGSPGSGCPILPVDLVNRGRSYMWPTDLRPRKITHP